MLNNSLYQVGLKGLIRAVLVLSTSMTLRGVLVVEFVLLLVLVLVLVSPIVVVGRFNAAHNPDAERV